MCGIFAVTKQKNAADTVLNGLKQLEYRGYDSWGVAVVTHNTFAVEKHAGKIGASVHSLPQSTMGFGHTRWATHGGVTDANAHPHLDCTKKIAIVHNGIIENYQELKKSLKKRHTFNSETDTEVLIHVIEENLQKNTFVETVRHAFQRLHGLNAVLVFSAEDHTLVAAKTGSPLILGRTKDSEYLFSSDLASLSTIAEKVRPLEDGEMVVVRNNTAQLYTLSGKKKTLKLATADALFSSQKVDKGGYAHFMLKEMHEQPRVIRHIAESAQQKHTTELVAHIKHAERGVLVGCGSAYYASLAGTALFAHFTKKQWSAVQGNEYHAISPALSKNMAAVCISQSGETIDVVEPAKDMKKRGMHVDALVNVMGSALSRLADTTIPLTAGPEICVASTKALTAMISHLIVLASAVGRKCVYGQGILKKAEKSIETLLTPQYYKRYLAPVIPLLAKQKNMFYIGRGFSYPTALESALKMKEIAYIHAEGFAGGELKHGMIALIEKGTPCVVFAPDDAEYDAVVANAMEIRARGGVMIGISSKPNSTFDIFLPVGDAQEATLLPHIVVGQLLAYYTAVRLGRDIDKPRNLAKSVTVK